MTLEEMKEQISLEGGVVRRAIASPRLEKTHSLDLSYLKTIGYDRDMAAVRQARKMLEED